MIPVGTTIEKEIENAKLVAVERCVAAGGDRKTIEVVEVDAVSVSYTMNGAADIYVRVVGDLVDQKDEVPESPDELLHGETFYKADLVSTLPDGKSAVDEATSKGSSYDIAERIDIKSYRPRIEGDLWYLSEIDVQFLNDGTGVLGVGSCGEPYPSYLALLEILRSGGDLTIRRQSTFPDDAVVLVAGFMVRPSPLIVLHLLNDFYRALRASTMNASQAYMSKDNSRIS